MVATDDGELYKVVLLHHGGSYDEAKVLKMDFSESRWRPVEDLGGRAFFVAPMYFGASCAPGGGRVRPDCVYSLVGVAKNTFRVFSLKDGTSEVRRLEEEQPAPETVGKSRPCWVLPTHPTLY
uniref:KIB1-4 beta-propeller domain-containing protein n=1 Tax=Aegilops tauschii subsp. strangulata TaxID=200361 RepID=A0A453MF94_AEGTS